MTSHGWLELYNNYLYCMLNANLTVVLRKKINSKSNGKHLKIIKQIEWLCKVKPVYETFSDKMIAV